MLRVCVVDTVAQQKKSKLPATRVGAKFDRQCPSADNWLPSFGRVWSKNCRTHNQYVDFCLTVCCNVYVEGICWFSVIRK